MSKDRARRRQAQLEQREQVRIQRERTRRREARWRNVRERLVNPARRASKLVNMLWRPLSGGQQGLLARRRRRRVVSVVVLAALLNLAVWVVTADVQTSIGMLVVTVIASPVLGRLLFSRR